MKSVTILKNVGRVLNLGHLETRLSNFKKFCHPRPEQSKLEKMWFSSRLRSFTL